MGFRKTGYHHTKTERIEQIPFRIDTVDPRFYYENQFGFVSQTKYVARESGMSVTTHHGMRQHWLLLIPSCVSDKRARKGATGYKDARIGFPHVRPTC